MANARHPRKYPAGTALPVTQAWKARVRAALHANLAAGRSPRTASELARMIGADKAGLSTMLKTDQRTYRYAREICDVLGIEEAMVANPAVEPDELERAVEILRKLPFKEQRQALAILEALLKQLDGT